MKNIINDPTAQWQAAVVVSIVLAFLIATFLRNSLLFVAILISLEIIRELPITLILRPFNFETFATTAYISASEDLLEAAAVPSLFLILIATFFIIVTSKYILRDYNE